MCQTEFLNNEHKKIVIINANRINGKFPCIFYVLKRHTFMKWEYAVTVYGNLLKELMCPALETDTTCDIMVAVKTDTVNFQHL